MRMRILFNISKKADEAVSGLKTLYSGSGCLVQSDEDVETFSWPDGSKIVFCGTVEGVTDKQAAVLQAFSEVKNFKQGKKEDFKFFDSLEGRYAFVIIGADGKKFLIGADGFGRRDLYYCQNGQQYVFATNITLLHEFININKYDQLALAHALTIYGYRPPKKHTLFEDVRRLGVQETARVSSGKVQFETRDFEPVETQPYGEAELNNFSDLMLEALKRRSSPDGNIVYCSSGWDSTSLVAALVHLNGVKNTRLLTERMFCSHRSGVMNEFEIKRVKDFASYYGVSLDIVDWDIRDNLPDLSKIMGPLAREHHIISYNTLTTGELARGAGSLRKNNEAVFAGEISDGAFSLGFSQFTTIFHPVQDFREYSDKMATYLFGPTFLSLFQQGKHEEDCIFQLLKGRRPNESFDSAVSGKKDRTMQLLSSFFLRGVRLPLWSLSNSRMLTTDGAADYEAEMQKVYLEDAAKRATPETLYSWYVHLYNSFHWQASTVSTFAETAEKHGFHVGLPYWDKRIQEYLSSMPENMGRGLDLNPTKYPLKWMLKNRIKYPMHLQTGPHSYQYDVNPDITPIGELVNHSAFSQHFRNILKDRRYHSILSEKVFNIKYIDSVVDDYLKKTEIRGGDLMNLVALCTFETVNWGHGCSSDTSETKAGSEFELNRAKGK